MVVGSNARHLLYFCRLSAAAVDGNDELAGWCWGQLILSENRGTLLSYIMLHTNRHKQEPESKGLGPGFGAWTKHMPFKG